MTLDIKKIGVIGCGQMGKGIAQVCAGAGFDVHLMDVNENAVKKAIPSIEKSLGRLVDKEKISGADKDTAIKRISTGSDMSGFKDCQLVIEAATEDEQVKKVILQELCTVLEDDALIASNTSSISITRLGAKTDRPGKFVGMHFMNPVPRMELVELIRGIATDEDTYRIVRELVEKLGKIPVNAEDFPAFIVNRILLPMINEAVYTLYEGVGSVKAIDSAMKLGTHHPMGPLELADFIGLDTCLAVMHVLHDGLADTKYRPCPLLVKYVEAGWLGRKSGKGFYDYSGDEPVPTR
ncbi:MAG: 3-hydroxybutyryl-CoA dehydrogenase [Rhodospirillales bacterium]|nr:3-hydroxybutyryl-CoA dehydrogenase [Alphaproteobacteria bacterium]MBL6948081.1 3-hydroxybutyryl-CoA dehydrogenase [Rhodospirillales bacterium]